VRLESSARFIGWDVISLGRPLSGDRYDEGRLDQRVEITIDGAHRLLERTRWSARDPMRERPWGLGGHEVLGTLWAYPADAALLARTRQRIAAAVASRKRQPSLHGDATLPGTLHA